MKSPDPGIQLPADRAAESVWQPNGRKRCFRTNSKNPAWYETLQFAKLSADCHGGQSATGQAGVPPFGSCMRTPEGPAWG